MTNKNFKLYFIGYFILFGIVITLISSLINYKLHLIEIENSIKKYAQEVSSSRINYILKPHIDKMDDIVSAIAHDKTLVDFIQTKNSAKEPELQNLFLTMTLAHKSIMHARLLDADGNEVIRVNRANEQSLPYISKDSQLQDKSLREYFEIVSKMTTQQIWHSKLNLNIENGKLEVPYSPTIRIAMPLFKENKFAGMVICNIHSNQLIDSIEDSPLFNLYIIDKDGYYILHPDRKYSWNKYTGVKRDLYEDFAQEAASILAKKTTGRNIYAYALDDILNNEDKAILILKPKEKSIDALKHTNRITTIIVALLSLFFSIPLAIYVSRSPTKLQQILQKSNIELQLFSDIIDKYVITATTKISGIITNVSTAFVKVSGFSKEELINQKMNIIHHPDTAKESFDDLWKTILLGKEWKGELKNKTKQGDSYWIKQTIIPIKDEKNEITSFMSVGVDISAKKELEILALTDKLTNLYNRRKVDECLFLEVEKSKRYNNPLSVIMIDIDYFKKVNDTYGHQTGDSVLKEVAKLLIANTRKIDCCGRFGGEEFIVLCPDTNKDGAVVLAEQIRIAVEEYIFETVEHLTISLGIATCEKTDDMNSLIKKCDEALYMAKAQGRNRSVYL